MALGLTLIRTFLSSSSVLSSPCLLPHSSPSTPFVTSSLFLSPSLSLSRYSSSGGEVTEKGGVSHMTPSISILRGGKGQEVYLVGTHSSEESADLVEEVMTTVKPDNIFLELCFKRAQQLADGSHLKQYDAFESASWIEGMLKNMGHVFPDSAFKLSKAYFQAIGLIPGEEYSRAMKVAHEMRDNSNSSKPEIIYGDIDGDTTISKIGDAVSLTAVFKMVNSTKGQDWSEFRRDPVCLELASKLQDPHTSVEKKIEVMKNREYVRVFSRVAHSIFPAGANALLKERDAFMCDGLLKLKNQTTVAVVGMAHMDGIEEEWQKHSGMS